MSLNPIIATLGRRLRLAVIGGGPGSFIGAMHRQAARLDDRYELVAASLSSDPQLSISAGAEIGLPTNGAVVNSAKHATSHGVAFCKAVGEIRSIDALDTASVAELSASLPAFTATEIQPRLVFVTEPPVAFEWVPPAVDSRARVFARAGPTTRLHRQNSVWLV